MTARTILLALLTSLALVAPAQAGEHIGATIDSPWQTAGVGCSETKWYATKGFQDSYANWGRCAGGSDTTGDGRPDYYWLYVDWCGPEIYAAHKWFNGLRWRINVVLGWPDPRWCVPTPR